MIWSIYFLAIFIFVVYTLDLMQVDFDFFHENCDIKKNTVKLQNFVKKKILLN